MLKKAMSVVAVFFLCISLSVPAMAMDMTEADSASVPVSTTIEVVNPIPEEWLDGNYEIYLSEPIPFINNSGETDTRSADAIGGFGQFAIVRRIPGNLDCIVYFTWSGERIGWVSTPGLEIYSGNILDNTLIDYIPDTMKNADGATNIWIPIDNVNIPTKYKTVVVIGNMNIFFLSTASWGLQTFPSFRVTIKDFDGI